MDLRLIPGAEPTAEEKDAIARALPQGETMPVDGSLRYHLLPALLAVQRRMGWISPGSLNEICLRLDVPPAEAYGVATFYDLLSTEPLPQAVVRVCDDIACRVNGAEAVCDGLERALGPEGTTGATPGPAWFRSPCLGHCERGPAALFQIAGDPGLERTLAPAGVEAILEGLKGRFPAPLRHSTGTLEGARPALLRRVGVVDPESLDSYRAHGGYEALARAFEMGAERVVQEIQASRLMGRGGAAFPTGRKWQAVAMAKARPHYLVCNADESEPGTFKDRVIMEEDPFAVIEAMTIGALATGSERGYIYVRGEYPLAAARLSLAIERARAAGLLGADIMNRGHSFYVEVRRGGGAYICGEETALFNSIEGKRGEPRNKPPFPVEVGLFGKPTAINNVETFVNVLEIVLHGGAAFAAIGTADSTGTRLFCVSGCVARPGLYEAPFGATLGELIETAGGVRPGRSLQAILLGGAAGTFVTAADLAMPLSFEGTRAAGASLGSGVIMVFDDTIDMSDIVLRIAAFFRHESCGQCVPCREGTLRQEETLLRIANGAGTTRADGGERLLLADIAGAMKDASICGLGQTAAFAVQSAIHKLGLFRDGGPGTAHESERRDA